MPPEVINYRRVFAAELVGALRGMVYEYARDQDKINVFVTHYDTAPALHTPKDTIDLVWADYTSAFDSLCNLAQQNGLRVSWYVHNEDNVRIWEA